MKVFTCSDHEGWWPVPTASVVVAENEQQARYLLTKELKKLDIEDNKFTLKELELSTQKVKVLSHGEY